MADVKISALPAATVPLAGTEVLPIVQSSTTRQVSVANLTAGRAISASSVTNSALTSGRVVYTTTGGLETSSANLLYSGTDLTVYGLTVGRGGGAVSDNTVLGASALSNGSQSGGQNTAIGNFALQANTSGAGNTALGYFTLYTNTTGASNSAVGRGSLFSNTTGANNTALGYQSLVSNTTASNNVAVGYQAGYTTSGADNTAIGYQAGYSSTTCTTNVFVGTQAGYNVTSGNSNVMIGSNAGALSVLSTTGDGNVYIGGGVRGSAATNATEIVIGYLTTGKGSSTGFINPNSGGVYQGNNSLSWSITSDARLKKNIVDNNTGLDKIAAIQVRNFEYRLPEEITDLPQNQAIKKEGVQLGAIAQELQQILPECVKTESTGVMSVDSDNLTWYMINAIKELKAEIDKLKGIK